MGRRDQAARAIGALLLLLMLSKQTPLVGPRGNCAVIGVITVATQDPTSRRRGGKLPAARAVIDPERYTATHWRSG